MNNALNKNIDKYQIKTDQFGKKHVHVNGGYLTISYFFIYHKYLVEQFNTDLEKR